MHRRCLLAIISVLSVVLLIPATDALAHEVEAGPNGGPVVDARDHHIELVLKADSVTVYVTRDDAPVDLEGASGRAIVLAGKKQSKLTLTPSTDALSSAADISVDGPLTVVVTVNLASEAPLQARFKLDALDSDAAAVDETSASHTEHGGHDAKAEADAHKDHATHHAGGHHGGGTIHLAASNDQDFVAGQTTPVTLTFKDKTTGEGLGPDNFDIAHTRKVHLLIADASLDDYHHIHPVPGADPGEWVFDFTPSHDRTYRIWADVVRTDTGAQEYVRTDLNIDAPEGPPPHRATVLNTTSAGFDWTLSLDKPLQRGEASMAEVTIKKNGTPFEALEPVMGAYAHMVGFSEDFETIAHVHPMGREPTSDTDRGGPTLRFHVTPEKAGLIRFWAQVQVGGDQVFAPFTLTVTE